MFCPDCGTDAGEANFCPECGNDLGALKSARKNQARTTGGQRRSSGGRAAANGGGAAAARPAPQARPKGGLSTSTTIWIVVAIAAVAAFAIVFIVSNRNKTSSAGTPVAPSTPIAADTSGTYDELVARANNFYDQGSTFIKNNDFSGAAPYYAAAAKVYAAAWKKQPGDPATGTDYATSLFYGGDIAGAIKQVDKVLAKNPTFQNALFNRGNFVSMQGQIAKQNGETAKAAKLFAQAKASYEAAVKVDPTTQSGQAAAQAIKSL